MSVEIADLFACDDVVNEYSGDRRNGNVISRLTKSNVRATVSADVENLVKRCWGFYKIASATGTNELI